MTWRTIDFQGTAAFEKTLAEQLQGYLAEKQGQYSQEIVESIPSDPHPAQPELAPSYAQKTLSDSIETFARKVHQEIANASSPPGQWQVAADGINRTLWKYTDLLQGIIQELFQQLDQVSIEKWRPELLDTVDAMKETITHHIEDLRWAVKRLDSQLWEYRASNSGRNKFLSTIMRPFSVKKGIVDPGIPKTLEKNQKFLNFRYQNFCHRYQQYIDLDAQVEKKMGKFQSYQTLQSLDCDEQENFKRLYRLLKLWKLNRQGKGLPDRDLVRVLRYAINPEKASAIFKHYFFALQNHLFKHSRELKRSHDYFNTPPSNPVDETIKILQLQGALSGQRFELHTLGATISAYHSFLLQSDPNPYVRTRGGFSEWIIGQEPTQTKALTTQEYDIEKLDTLHVQFLEALKEDKLETAKEHHHLYQQIEEAIHEMSQPLASPSTMASKAQRLLEPMQKLHELSTTDGNVVKQMTPLLSRAMRADWKYQVLHDNPLFHQTYMIHKHILPPSTDRSHLGRLRQFNRLLQQLKEWVKEKNTLSHLHKIELDINDIKGYLQDFLGQLQRSANDPALFSKENGEFLINDTAQQLLEYRYLFGEFFHELHQSEIEERMLRNQFLFVDHYFETVENKLVEMRQELRSKLEDHEHSD